MSFGQTSKRLNSVKLRLALLSAFAFFSTSLLSFLYLFSAISETLEKDGDTGLLQEVQEFSDIYADGGIEALRKEVGFEESVAGSDNAFFIIFDEKGQVLATSDVGNWGSSAEVDIELMAMGLMEPVLDTRRVSNHGQRVRRVYGPIGDDRFALMGRSLTESDSALAEIRVQFIATLCALFVICGALAWLIARKAMSGVEAVTSAVLNIKVDELDQRVELPGGGEEIDRLAAAFNTMLDRIERLIKELKETHDNIAHDIRSPIARIRVAAEAALTWDSKRKGFEEAGGEIVEECDRLLSMVNTMLDISELEAGVAKLNLARADGGAIARNTCELFQPVADTNGVNLECSVCDETEFEADEQKIRRALIDLVDNALKYASEGGNVKVAVRNSGETMRFTVSDTGPGIPRQEFDRVFERFYRGDRDRSKPGNGLGLSLVRAVVNAHGGRVQIESESQKGTSITLSVPLKHTN